MNILAVTGIRSEYDLMYPLLKAICNDANFDLSLVVCGAHLTPLHNYSVSQIEKDGFHIVEKIENLLYSDSLAGKAKSSGILMQSLTQTLDREKPDCLLVLGDREEVIIGALAANYLNIPVIHIAGGDNTSPSDGDVDEQVRHATTKLSHLHLTMAQSHSQRILNMGEEPWRVHTVGNGGIDRLRTEMQMSRKELSIKLETNMDADYGVLIYHPLSSNISESEGELRTIFESVLDTGCHVFVGAPNGDPGTDKIMKLIEEYRSHPRVFSYSNLPRPLFVNLLRHASFLIGNSSLAFHEACYLELPSINVGERQKNRLAGSNVQFVNARHKEIRTALEKALYDKDYLVQLKEDKFLYGDGFMAEKSMDILKSLSLKKRLLAKKIMY